MSEIVVIGGFGSEPKQVDSICERIQETRQQNVVGMNFREASAHPRALANLISGAELITHSGGILPAMTSIERYRAVPETLIAIAPPAPDQIKRLLYRGALIGMGLERIHSSELGQKFTSRHELIHHAFANFGQVANLAAMNSFADIAHLQKLGVDTIIGIMEKDSLFDMSTEPAQEAIERARKFGTKVVGIHGGHCRFTSQPTKVLSEIDSADDYVPHKRLNLALSDLAIRHLMPRLAM